MSPFRFSLHHHPPIPPFPLHHHPPIPSFPLHRPSCGPLHSLSHRTLQFPLLAYHPRHHHLHHRHLRYPHLLQCSAAPSAVVSSNSESGPDVLQFDIVKRRLCRLLLIAAICGLAVVRCHRGIAAEGAVLNSGRSVLVGSWPKIAQISQVFREHGLILAAHLSLSAFFSAAETSITTLWPWKICLCFTICKL